jgi:membrane fusion protein, copper/silver efflux system
MKKHIFILAVLFVTIMGAGLVILPVGCGRNGSDNSAAKNIKYHCPMHPTVVSDKPGDCPICGMKLVLIEGEKHESAAAPQKTTMYRSTMNPNEVSAKPGKDSMGMEMEAFEVTGGGASAVPGLAAVSITLDARRRMGLTLGTVEKRTMTHNIRTSARIVADETRLFRVTTKVEGWVDKLLVSVSGQAVRKGDPLLTIYSPQLVSAQQEYLTALQAVATLTTGGSGDAADGGKRLIESARQRLQLWDVSDEQIARLEKTHEVEKTITLQAPSSGFVTEKNVMAGQKIMAGDSLMIVADLSTVWGDAAIYESDLPYVQTGMPMRLSLPYWQDKTFEGKVSFLSSALDPETRTLKIRIEIPNPELLLKTEMYAEARLSYDLGERVAVPESAVMRTGERSYAFREAVDGTLIPVLVKIGARNDGYFEVIEGLKPGDRVVTSANFLVDSESSMKAALNAITGGE